MTNKELQEELKKYPEDIEMLRWNYSDIDINITCFKLLILKKANIVYENNTLIIG